MLRAASYKASAKQKGDQYVCTRRIDHPFAWAVLEQVNRSHCHCFGANQQALLREDGAGG